jgi:hypothetical protein
MSLRGRPRPHSGGAAINSTPESWQGNLPEKFAFNHGVSFDNCDLTTSLVLKPFPSHRYDFHRRNRDRYFLAEIAVQVLGCERD